MRNFFSIIVPTYNSEKTCAKALKSILDQKYEQFEILIIDGASSDQTLKIVASFNDQRIRIFSESDKGVYDAMNKGLNLAKGNWIYFLGSDDELYDDRVLFDISKIITGIKSLDIIYGNVFFSGDKKIYDYKFTSKKLIHKNISHQSIFFRKRVFEKYSSFDISFPIAADYIHNMQWFHDPSIEKKFINRVIAIFGQNGLSSTQKDTKFNIDHLDIKKKYFPWYSWYPYAYRNKRYIGRLIKFLVQYK